MTSIARHRLVAYDGSAPAKGALHRAVELTAPGDAVSVVIVMAIIIVARHSGHHGPHPLGSVTTRVVRDAPCDVLVVHGSD